MQAVSEQTEVPSIISSTQEQERQRKLEIMAAVFYHAGQRGCDLSVLIPKALGRWTKMVNGQLVPTF